MRHIIVTEPGTKQELQFAYDLLLKQDMRPKWHTIEEPPAGSKYLRPVYMVTRPISLREIKEMSKRGGEAIAKQLINVDG